MNNSKATKFAGNVGGVSGEKDIAKMWRAHFEKLYNSGCGNHARQTFMNITSNIGIGNNVHFTIHNIINAVHKQKEGKSRSSDGVSMEAIINGDIKLHIHLAMIFNLFIKFR